MRWYAMSTRFLTDPKIEQLGEKHGPIGPLVVVALLAEAGVQEKAGEVEATYRNLAHTTFSDTDTVRDVVDTAVDLGLCHAESRDVTRCLLTFPAWERHQATYRKQKSRARQSEPGKPPGKANVTDGHAESRDVTNRTGQDRTKETTRSARASEPVPPEWQSVCQALDRVCFSRSLPSPKVPAVVKACEAFADRDHALEIEKFEHYYVDGAGQNRRIKDMVGSWRNWLRSAPPAEIAIKRTGKSRKSSTEDLAAYAGMEPAT